MAKLKDLLSSLFGGTSTSNLFSATHVRTEYEGSSYSYFTGLTTHFLTYKGVKVADNKHIEVFLKGHYLFKDVIDIQVFQTELVELNLKPLLSKTLCPCKEVYFNLEEYLDSYKEYLCEHPSFFFKVKIPSSLHSSLSENLNVIINTFRYPHTHAQRVITESAFVRESDGAYIYTNNIEDVLRFLKPHFKEEERLQEILQIEIKELESKISHKKLLLKESLIND